MADTEKLKRGGGKWPRMTHARLRQCGRIGAHDPGESLFRSSDSASRPVLNQAQAQTSYIIIVVSTTARTIAHPGRRNVVPTPESAGLLELVDVELPEPVEFPLWDPHPPEST